MAASAWCGSTRCSTIFRIGFFYSSNFLNVESWLGHVPGQIAPYVNLTPQPLLWEVATYTGVFLAYTLLLQRVWRGLARRFTTWSAAGLFGGTLGVAVALNLLLELPFVPHGPLRLSGRLPPVRPVGWGDLPVSARGVPGRLPVLDGQYRAADVDAGATG